MSVRSTIRPCLSMLVKMFRLPATELVDLIEIRDGRIASYTEFFAPC